MVRPYSVGNDLVGKGREKDNGGEREEREDEGTAKGRIVWRYI